MSNRLFIPIFIALVFIAGGLLYVYNPEPLEYKDPDKTEPTACTLEAKLCPDGSYVGRTGPDCEFESCPLPPGAIFEDGTIIEENPPLNGSSTEPVFCTADVKLCPDGSYVGRVAPKCDFAKCP